MTDSQSLEAVVAQLPKTADGVYIVPGMTLYCLPRDAHEHVHAQNQPLERIAAAVCEGDAVMTYEECSETGCLCTLIRDAHLMYASKVDAQVALLNQIPQGGSAQPDPALNVQVGTLPKCGCGCGCDDSVRT